MLDPKKFKKNIISDLRVELAEEFDKNFTRKAFLRKNRKSAGTPTSYNPLAEFI